MKIQPQTFEKHVQELRRRFLWVFIAISVSATLGYYFRNPIITILQKPLNSPLFYSSPGGSFSFVIKVAIIIGVFIALPVMVYQLLRFIEPALPNRIKNSTMIKLILSSFLLASVGVLFGFFIMIPLSLKFFAGYSSDQIRPLISAMEYLNFVLNTLITFAVIFQMPLFVLFINTITPLKPKTLLKYQRHVIVGAFVLALVLPFTYDPISQFVMAVPILLLFYLSVLLLWITKKNYHPPAPSFVVDMKYHTAPPAAPANILQIENIPIIPLILAPGRMVLGSLDGVVQGTPKITNVALKTLQQASSTDSKPPSHRTKTSGNHFSAPNLSIDGIRPTLHTI